MAGHHPILPNATKCSGAQLTKSGTVTVPLSGGTPNATEVGHARIGSAGKRGAGSAKQSAVVDDHHTAHAPQAVMARLPCAPLPWTPTPKENRTTVAWMHTVAPEFLWCTVSDWWSTGRRGAPKKNSTCFFFGAPKPAEVHNVIGLPWPPLLFSSKNKYFGAPRPAEVHNVIGHPKEKLRRIHK